MSRNLAVLAPLGMSANDNHNNSELGTTDGTPRGAALETLHYIEDMLFQLRKMAGNLNEPPLNYFLEMANLEAKQRLQVVKSQQNEHSDQSTHSKR